MTADPRRVLGDAVQAVAAEFVSDDGAQRGVVIGWLLISEVLAPDGERWLTHMTGDATGTKRVPRWQAQGYAHSILHEWPPDPDNPDVG